MIKYTVYDLCMQRPQFQFYLIGFQTETDWNKPMFVLRRRLLLLGLSSAFHNEQQLFFMRSGQISDWTFLYCVRDKCTAITIVEWTMFVCLFFLLLLEWVSNIIIFFDLKNCSLGIHKIIDWIYVVYVPDASIEMSWIFRFVLNDFEMEISNLLQLFFVSSFFLSKKWIN